MPGRKKQVPVADDAAAPPANAPPEPAPEQPPPEEKPKQQRAARTAGTKSKPKEAPKKQTVKKTVAKKPAVKKAATKKNAPVRAQLKKTISVKKSKPVKKTKKAKSAPAPSAYTKYQVWVAEAVQQLKTPEHPFVSFNKIKQYLLDYVDAKQPFRIPKLGKQARLSPVHSKLLKARKNSYAFTKLGEGKIAPSKAEKRKKIVRKEKKQTKPKTKEPVRNPVMLGTGRISRPRQFA
jgi:hypothetical protein